MRKATFATISRLFPQGGYGFATASDGREIYFHQHAVVGHAFTMLKVGEAVQLEITQLPDDEHAHAVVLRRAAQALD